ncbi:GNAT family N-acetyltransferase [Paenibacillus sp. GCM10012307]|uniref:GNAT family N-acetyltransferase n=1 Tax=Paenibacillus roseus TaxID=2798579 RepID=A0A934J6E8_9BACL|nr:GNAT family N-acetyltransferase [Paenibacillus roseus]MBJ6361235.1 GNAT family N-acetyltransferase [Paenibacillus roseus]
MIREAYTEDLASIQEFIHKTVDVMHEEGSDQWDSSYPQIRHFKEDIEHHSLYVKETDEGVQACITVDQKMASLYKDIAWTHPEDPAMTFHRLAVNPHARKGGLAKELIQFAENLAAAQGIRWIRIDTYSLNYKAQTLFTRLGYTKKGEIVYPGKSHPFYCYEKDLQE